MKNLITYFITAITFVVVNANPLRQQEYNAQNIQDFNATNFSNKIKNKVLVLNSEGKEYGETDFVIRCSDQDVDVSLKFTILMDRKNSTKTSVISTTTTPPMPQKFEELEKLNNNNIPNNYNSTSVKYSTQKNTNSNPSSGDKIQSNNFYNPVDESETRTEKKASEYVSVEEVIARFQKNLIQREKKIGTLVAPEPFYRYFEIPYDDFEALYVRCKYTTPKNMKQLILECAEYREFNVKDGKNETAALFEYNAPTYSERLIDYSKVGYPKNEMDFI